MTYLSMVMLSPTTTVAGIQLDPTAGVIILALASLIAWLLTRPIKRITGMLSYAATGNSHQLSEQRRRAMAGLSRLTPLPRWRRGRSHRVSDPQENPTDTVTPTGPARPSRPEQAAIVRRRNTTAQPASAAQATASPTANPAPGPASTEPPTTGIPRIKPATVAGETPVIGRPSVSDRPRETPVGDAGVGHPTPAGVGMGFDGRRAGGQIHRQVWDGRSWVLADDDRVFRPADPDHRPAGPAPTEPAVFRPPDPPPWADHGRPEIRTSRWPSTVDDPRGTR